MSSITSRIVRQKYHDQLPLSPASMWWPERIAPTPWLAHAPFVFWLVDTVRPRLIVDWSAQDGASFVSYCQAVRQAGLATRCVAFPAQTAFLEPAEPSFRGLAQHIEANYATFAEIRYTKALEARAALAIRSIDLLHIDCTEDGGEEEILDACFPSLTEGGIVLVHGTRFKGRAHPLWVSLSKRFPAFEFAHGRGLGLAAVGQAVPEALHSLFEAGSKRSFIARTYERLGAAAFQEIDPGNRGAEELIGGQLAPNRGILATATGETLLQMGRVIEKQRQRLNLLSRALRTEARGAYVAAEQLRNSRAEVAALRSSTSWRITAPIRTLSRLLVFPPRIKSSLRKLSFDFRNSIRNAGWNATLGRAAAAGRRRLLRTRMHSNLALHSAISWNRRPARSASELLELRVLIVAEMSIPQCLKYRVVQKQQMIEDLGFDCTVVSWTDVENVSGFLQTHSIVIFYRVPGFPLQLELIQLAKSLGVTTYWEVDDLIFDADKYLRNANLDRVDAATRQGVIAGVPLYRAAMLACDQCIASTSGLAEAMRDAGVSAVQVIENALDEETIRLAAAVFQSMKRDDGLVRIAYGSGTKTHDADFRAAAEGLKRVLTARPNVRLRILGELNLPNDFDEVSGQIERLPLSNYATYLERLSECDISIAPLEDNVFNDAKSNIKYLEAAIIGLPSVCSPRAAFRAAIQDGDTGLLASGQAAWEQALLKLVDNKQLRAEMGDRARRHVQADYAPATISRRQVIPVLTHGGRSAKLRILGVNVYFEPRRFGGATIIAEEMARQLNRGDEIEYLMFTTLPSSEVAPYKLVRYEASACSVFAMGLPDEGDPTLGFDNPYSAHAFRDVLRAVRPDVVHLHSIQGIGAQIADVCREEGIPFVITLHDAWWVCGRQFLITRENRPCSQRAIDLKVCATCVDNPGVNAYRQSRLSEILDAAALLLVPSEYFRELIIENGFDPARVALNKNGVAAPIVTRDRTTDHGVLRFGYIGGETPIKGAHLIKSIFRRLPYVNYRLRVVDNVLNLGRRSIDPAAWQVPGKLEIVPAYTQETIDEFFNDIDVLLCPTQAVESFGLAVREALIRHVWVIATDAGALSEDIVPGQNGEVVPLNSNGDEFRRAVERLLENPSQLYDYRNPYVDRIRLFADQASELAKLLRDVSSRHQNDLRWPRASGGRD